MGGGEEKEGVVRYIAEGGSGRECGLKGILWRKDQWAELMDKNTNSEMLMLTCCLEAQKFCLETF